MITIKDVALEAGVSIATVSRILNRKGIFKKETAEKVYRAIEKLGYEVNPAAKSLKTGLTGTVGIALNSFYFLNFTLMIRNAIKILYNFGFFSEIILDPDFDRTASLLHSGKYDGLILVDAGEDRSLKKLLETGKEFVILGGDVERDDINLIEIDYFQGGYSATKELTSLGHTNILFISDDPSLTFVREIKRGFLLALDEQGIQFKEELIVESSKNFEETRENIGYEAVEKALEGTDFSAIITTGDEIAYGAIRCLAHKDISVPLHKSVVGIGDYNQSKYYKPPLTSVMVPLTQMAELGAEILAHNIKRKDSVVTRVKLQTQLIKRGTTARPLIVK